MAQFENMRKVDLANGEPAAFSLRQLYYADIEANRIGAIVLMNGEPFPLSGTCTGTAIRADGTTVPMTGTVEGNQAYIILTADCYAVEGDIQIFVKLTTGAVTATLAAARGTVRLTETGAVIDPGEIIPSVAALITAINDAVESIPADYSALLAAIAPDYADLTFPITAGTWCWYNGSLERAAVDIPASESWTAAHWEAAPLSNALAGDIQDLKSAFGEFKERVSSNPRIVETEEDDAELYIADADGYVIAQFSDGHIQTKEFDSADVGDLDDLETEDKTSIVAAINEALDSVPQQDAKVVLIEETTDIDIADREGYVVVRFKDGHIKTKNFDSSTDIPKQPVQYKFSDSCIMLSYPYNSTVDAVVVFNVGRANDLFDFHSFNTIPAGASLNDYTLNTLTRVWGTGTDMHGPFKFLAVNNPDGYYAEATWPGFTGGNHTQTINSETVKTASSKYVHYFADGKPVASGYGRCNRFEIRWANNVQAYNCVKADGTGRTSLIEYHDMIFDGVKFNEDIMLVPQEDIKMNLWYGLQTVSWKTTYTSIRFRDATNRGLYTSADNSITSGNAVTSAMIEEGPTHSMETAIDTTIDLGKRPFYSGTEGAFASNSNAKAYFTIIEQGLHSMYENDAYFLRGSYRFYPTVS